MTAFLNEKYPGHKAEPRQCKGEGIQAAYAGKRFYFVNTRYYGGVPRDPRFDRDELSALVCIDTDGNVNSSWSMNDGLIPITDQVTAKVAAAAIMNVSNTQDHGRNVDVEEFTAEHDKAGWHCTVKRGQQVEMEVEFDTQGKCVKSYYMDLNPPA